MFYIVVVLAYEGLQFSVMATHGKTSFKTYTVLNKYSQEDKFENTGGIGFNIAFLVHDELLRPMPNFDKIASFELIQYIVNYDTDVNPWFDSFPDFPAKG